MTLMRIQEQHLTLPPWSFLVLDSWHLLILDIYSTLHCLALQQSVKASYSKTEILKGNL